MRVHLWVRIHIQVHSVNGSYQHSISRAAWKMTHMIRPDCVNLDNVVAKCRCFVDEQLQEIVRCRFSSNELEFCVYRACP